MTWPARASRAGRSPKAPEPVAGERLLRILARFSAGGEVELGSLRLCQVCADVVVMSGAGIMLMSTDVAGGSLCSTDDVSARIEELQYVLGEGPCVDAYRHGRPVLEPDLADPVMPRWSAFAAPAVEAGVGAIFGFPLRSGAVRLGALNLYRDRPGSLSPDQFADSLVMADVAARAVIAMQAHAPAGAVAAELEEGTNFRSVVHQASGMVAVQLGVSVGEALISLRARAFADDRPLGGVADDVVGRRLRFE